MTSAGSVTRCIDAIRGGDGGAIKELMDRYLHRLVGLARKKLENAPRGPADEEDDVALSAFDTLCRGAQEGRFPDLADRDCLWRLLVRITVCKAGHAIRDEQRHSPRGGAAMLSDDEVIGRLVSREPDPALAAEVAEEYRRLLAQLPKPDWRVVAAGRMQGFTEKELADRMGCAVRSIKRKLAAIREFWESEGRP